MVKPFSDVIREHPLPWNIHENFPAPGYGPDKDVLVDANGETIIGCSEWFTVEDGVLEALVAAINAKA